MDFDLPSDTDLAALVAEAKTVENPAARWAEKPGHRQRNHTVRGERHDYVVYLRQNTTEAEDFSCGIAVIKPDGQRLTLRRYNGPGHRHGDIGYACHVHAATAAAIAAGRKPESAATPSDRYHTLDGALAALAEECNVSGFRELKPDEPDLFRR